jgi:hypothetical protein
VRRFLWGSVGEWCEVNKCLVRRGVVVEMSLWICVDIYYLCGGFWGRDGEYGTIWVMLCVLDVAKISFGVEPTTLPVLLNLVFF